MRDWMGLEIDSSEGSELRLKAGSLPRGEIGHAPVISVVHEVSDGLEQKIDEKPR